MIVHGLSVTAISKSYWRRLCNDFSFRNCLARSYGCLLMHKLHKLPDCFSVVTRVTSHQILYQFCSKTGRDVGKSGTETLVALFHIPLQSLPFLPPLFCHGILEVLGLQAFPVALGSSNGGCAFQIHFIASKCRTPRICKNFLPSLPILAHASILRRDCRERSEIPGFIELHDGIWGSQICLFGILAFGMVLCPQRFGLESGPGHMGVCSTNAANGINFCMGQQARSNHNGWIYTFCHCRPLRSWPLCIAEIAGHGNGVPDFLPLVLDAHSRNSLLERRNQKKERSATRLLRQRGWVAKDASQTTKRPKMLALVVRNGFYDFREYAFHFFRPWTHIWSKVKVKGHQKENSQKDQTSAQCSERLCWYLSRHCDSSPRVFISLLLLIWWPVFCPHLLPILLGCISVYVCMRVSSFRHDSFSKSLPPCFVHDRRQAEVGRWQSLTA